MTDQPAGEVLSKKDSIIAESLELVDALAAQAADPAQSAPSAEPTDAEMLQWWGDAADQFEPKIGYPNAAVVLGLMAKVREAAAIRTAQLERELRDYQDGIDNAMFINVPEYGFSSALRSRKRTVEFVAETLKFAQGQRETLKTRAETAESALRQIQEYVMIHFSHYLEGNADSKGKHHGIPATHFTGLRALLTVAAQTPQQVKNPGAGEKEER